jgi:hypothetical protein
MNTHHKFLFEPGIWLGEGKVQLSVSEDDLQFFTRWNIGKQKEKGVIDSSQEIEIKGLQDKSKNLLIFTPLGDDEFKVELENENIGKVQGKGVIRPKLIAWEFRSLDKVFEGFEVYELLEDGSYFMHAEYINKEELRTQIQGKIWKKLTS